MTEKTIVRTDTRPAVTIHDFHWMESEWDEFPGPALDLDASVARYMAAVEACLPGWHVDWESGRAYVPGRFGEHALADDADLQGIADDAVRDAIEHVHTIGAFWVAAK